MEVLLEELYVGEGLEALLGKPAAEFGAREYPHAVAVALILRHSWRADDLACILARLQVTDEPSVKKVDAGMSRRKRQPRAK
jgi:hypothetical protein